MVAVALDCKGALLEKHGKVGEAMAVFDEIIRRYGEAPRPTCANCSPRRGRAGTGSRTKRELDGSGHPGTANKSPEDRMR
jgi:hypothetical protein